MRTIPGVGKLLYTFLNILICSALSLYKFHAKYEKHWTFNKDLQIQKLASAYYSHFDEFYPLNCTPTLECFYFYSSQTVKALNAASQHSFIYSVTQSCGAPASQRLISHQQFAAAVTLNIHNTRAAICGWRTPACLGPAIKDVTCWVRTCPWAASAFHPTSRCFGGGQRQLHMSFIACFFSFVCFFC